MYSQELIDVLYAHPYCKVKFLVDAGIAKRQTAAKYLKDLETLGLLKSEKIGRERVYYNKPLLALLQSL